VQSSSGQVSLTLAVEVFSKLRSAALLMVITSLLIAIGLAIGPMLMVGTLFGSIPRMRKEMGGILARALSAATAGFALAVVGLVL